MAERDESPIERIAVEEVVLGMTTQTVDLDLDAILTDVERVIDETDLDVGLFTDEEIHLLGLDDEPGDDDLDAPRLGQLPPEARRTAVEAVAHVLLARGDLHLLGEGEVVASGRSALVATLRGAPLGVARLRIDVRGELEPIRAALFHVSDRAVMLEQVDGAGIHHLILTAPVRAVAWLLRQVAPDDLPREDLAATRAKLLADLDELTERAQRSAVVVVARASRNGLEERTQTVYLVDGRLTVVEGWDAAGVGETIVQRLGESSATRWARWIVEETIRPDLTGHRST